MNTVIVRRPVNPLAKLIPAPGGLTMGEALADADARLKGIEDACLVELHGLLAKIHAFAQTLGPSPAEDQIDVLHGLGNEVLSIAAVAGLPDVGQAAHSLCELVDGLRTRAAWNSSAVKVHLDGLKLLAEPALGLGPEQTQAVVTGLRQVVHRALR
jgi:hypothetical protein